MQRHSRTNVIRYGSAVLGVATATAARLALDPILGDLFPFATLFFAGLIVAGYAGRGPALLATGLGALVSARFLLPPRDSFAVHGVENQAGLVLYLTISLGIAILGGALRDARRGAEAVANEALRQREQSQITLASIGDAVLVTDGEGRVSSQNPVAEALTGWSASEAAGQPLPSVFRIVNEETRLEVENPALRALREGAVVGLANHTVLIARDGTERPIDDSAAPIRDPDGRVIGAVLVFRDIGERRRAEAEVRRAGEQARTILESVTDAFFALGRDWRFTYVNRQAERVLDRRPGDLLGKVLWDEYPGLAGSEFERAYHRANDQRVVVTFTSYYPDHDRWYEVHAYPAPDGLSVYFRDVTERVQAEERVRFQAHLLDTVGQAVIVTDPQGRITYWNRYAETLYGWRADEATGLSILEVVVAEELAGRAEEIMARIRAGEGWSGEFTVRRRDGTTFPAFVTDTPVFDERGTLKAIVGVSMDITGRKLAEERLRRSEQQLADFFENATVGLHWVGPDGTILRANREELDLLGYEREEYVGRHIAEFHDDEDAISDILRRLQAGEVLHDYPARLRCKDGSVKDVLIDSSVLWEDGQFVHTRCFTRDVTERKRAEEALREQTRIAEALNRIGVLLASELDLDRLVQVVTDEATRLTDARFGAFFHNVPDEEGGAYSLYTISGVPREAFSKFPMPRATELFGPTFRNEGVIRLDDVTQDPRFGRNAPNHGMPEGHLPVRSYLAVPVASRPGEVLGGLFFGHPEPGVFDESDERLVVGIAAQAAVAIDNARLYREMQESDRRFRQLADAVPQVVWSADGDGATTYYNRRWFDYTGLTPEKSLAPGGWRAAVHPDDLPALKEAARAAGGGGAFEAEYRLRDRAGAYRWHLGRGVPVVGEDGRVLRQYGTATDIDDRKRSERDARFLAEASATLAGIVDEASTLQKVADLAVPFFADWCSVDMAGEGGQIRRVAVAHIDPAKVELAHDLHRRYPPAPDAATGLPQVVRTGESQRVAEITDEMLVAGVPDGEHLRILRELGLKSYMCVPLNGRTRTLGAISFVAAESGRRYGPEDLRMAEDLAARASIAIENARLYAELKETDRRKNDFLATLAHELRNPLAPIRNTLHLMRETDGNGPLEAERAMAERNVVHLARLIDDLMDIARINRGRIELSKGGVDLATVVSQAVETARPLIDERRHELTVAMPEGAIRVEADPTRLEQVFWNLLNNSAKYTGPGGQIRLSAERDGGEVVVRVRDTGIGMRAEMLPKVFDMFVQVGEHRDHAQGGLGIGLSLVRTLVEMHGGSISAHSDGPGHGSEFVVRLPVLSPTPGAEAPLPDRRGEPDGETPRRRILVVDDNVDAARSLARLLGRVYGQEVRVAHDGPEALAVAEDFGPEVVLLDIGLPGMDGDEVARRLRLRPESRRAMLVALTGWGQEDDVARSREAGFDHHLVKPADPEMIRAILYERSEDDTASG